VWIRLLRPCLRYRARATAEILNKQGKPPANKLFKVMEPIERGVSKPPTLTVQTMVFLCSQYLPYTALLCYIHFLCYAVTVNTLQHCLFIVKRFWLLCKICAQLTSSKCLLVLSCRVSVLVSHSRNDSFVSIFLMLNF
jgi:hypothetical protein